MASEHSRQFLEIKGVRVPRLGLGTWGLRGWLGRRAISHAIGLGYRHIDTAQSYENESDVGRALRLSGITREAFFLATKLAQGRLSSRMVHKSVEESLRRLRTDYIDLLMIHWPDLNVPLTETLDAMMEEHVAGRVRFIGVSNFDLSMLAQAAAFRGVQLFCNQIEYHPFLSQEILLSASKHYDMMLTAYSPIARGRVNDDPVISVIATRHGKTPAQISLRWLIEQDRVVAIPKASSIAHAAENLSIFDFELTGEEQAAIRGLSAARCRIQPLIPGIRDES